MISNSRPVALSGRVPVKVNNEGGSIVIGDRITLSSVAGVGKKATATSETVGVALEAMNDVSGTIEVFVSLREHKVDALPTDSIDFATLGAEMNVRLEKLESMASTTSSVTTNESIWDMILSKLSAIGVSITDTFTRITNLFVGTLHIEDKVCVDDVCITKDQFKSLLIQAGGVSSASTTATTTVSATTTDTTGNTNSNTIVNSPIVSVPTVPVTASTTETTNVSATTTEIIPVQTSIPEVATTTAPSLETTTTSNVTTESTPTTSVVESTTPPSADTSTGTTDIQTTTTTSVTETVTPAVEVPVVVPDPVVPATAPSETIN